MEYTFEELKTKTVAQLRDIAREIEHEAVRGYSSMHKEDLLHAICDALGLEEHEHHEVVGIDKSRIKAKIRELKKVRAAALEAHDHPHLKSVRKQIKRLKRRIRRATM